MILHIKKIVGKWEISIWYYIYLCLVLPTVKVIKYNLDVEKDTKSSFAKSKMKQNLNRFCPSASIHQYNMYIYTIAHYTYTL